MRKTCRCAVVALCLLANACGDSWDDCRVRGAPPDGTYVLKRLHMSDGHETTEYSFSGGLAFTFSTLSGDPASMMLNETKRGTMAVGTSEIRCSTPQESILNVKNGVVYNTVSQTNMCKATGMFSQGSTGAEYRRCTESGVIKKILQINVINPALTLHRR